MGDEEFKDAAQGVEAARAEHAAASIAWREGGWPASGPLRKRLDKAEKAVKKASDDATLAAGGTVTGPNTTPEQRMKWLRQWESTQGRGK